MTAETSNARGETYTFDMIEDAWGDAVPLTKPYFNRFRARLETLRQSAAPPPAAARGDVRGLVDTLVDAAYQDGMQELDAMSNETLSARSALEQALAQQPVAVDVAAAKRAVAAVMSAPDGISVEAFFRIVLEAAVAGQRQEPTT